MSRRLLLVVLVAVLALGACDSERRAISRDDLPDVSAEPTVSVELDDDGFSDETLEITTADLVEFHNIGAENHGVRTEDYAIDTGPLFPDESTFVIFDTAGRYTIFDTEDDGASMEVLVTSTAPAD